MAGQIEVARLVDVAASQLKLNVEYDAAALKAAGLITLRLDGAVSDQELWALMNRVLAMRGFTTVRVAAGHRGPVVEPGAKAESINRRPVYSIVRTTDAAGLVLIAPESIGVGAAPESGHSAIAPGFQTVVVRARYRTAKELADGLAKVLSKSAGGGGSGGGGSAVAIDDSGGLLLLSDLTSRLEQAMTLLRLLDVPVGATEVIEISVRSLSAPALATLIAQVSAKRELVAREKVPGEVLASPAGNSLLVVAPTERVAYWRDLIGQLDRRERVETASYAPQSFSAREVAVLVEQTIKDPPGVPPDDRWRLVADELTGTLIITATPSQQEQVRTLIERLDSTPAAAQRPARSFLIKNRPVQEIRAILEQMAGAGLIGSTAGTNDGGLSNGGSSRSAPSQGATPWPPQEARPAIPNLTTPTSVPPSSTSSPLGSNPQASARQLSSTAARPASQLSSAAQESALRLTTDDGTNTLIVMAEPRTLAHIEALLVTLDVRQPQVMLEVLMVSVSDSQALNLGVELDKLVISGDTSIRLSSLFGLSGRSGAGEPLVGNGAGFTGLVLSPGDFSIVIRALQTLNKGRSLSMPRLLVANNQQATLNSTLDQPYASTNASNTVTTTSFGGSQQAGTQVSLKPQIVGGAGGMEGGDHLNLEYSISLSSFVGASASANLPPPKQENRVQSSASIPDGYTVVVGGIELDTDGKGTSQVPGLGNIPILGEAFKSRTNTSSRTRFYVFIRANVLRRTGHEDLKYLSDVAAANAGVDDGWPVVEPRVIK
ncbi:MAG: secretin N-terminal domain-containing protein [Phycisphaerales bacterium]